MTVKEALKKMHEILESPQYPQISHTLLTYESNYRSGKYKITGKCAIGEMSCRLGVGPKINVIEDTVPLKGTINKLLGRAKTIYDIRVDSKNVYFDTIKALGFPDELNTFILPELSTLSGFDFEEKDGVLVGHTGISSYITRLNDSGLSYKEILDFMDTTFEGYDD